MIEAYFDESGIHAGADVCIVAGYFGHSAQWKIQKEKWLGVLKLFNFPLQDFHAVDLVRNRASYPMLRKLAESISTSEIYPVSSGIVVEDFFCLSEPQRRFLTGATLMSRSGKFSTSGSAEKPYFVPFQHVVRNTTDYIEEGRKANFFFGSDQPTSRYAKRFLDDLRSREVGGDIRWNFGNKIGAINFPAAKETPQLQAADLYCHLSFLYMKERLRENNWTVLPQELLLTCLQRTRSQTDHGYETRSSLETTLNHTPLRSTVSAS